MSTRSRVEGTARALTLSPQIIVTDVTIGSAAQPAMLVTRDDAGKVMQAIETTVEQVRKSEVSARFE